MSTPTKVQMQFSNAAMPAPEIWLEKVVGLAESLSTELGVSTESPVEISLVGVDHPKLLFIQTTGTAVMTLTMSDNSELEFTGDVWVLGFDAAATIIPKALAVELPAAPAPEEGEDPVVVAPIKLYVRTLGV